jgi:serine/threonine protein kinase
MAALQISEHDVRIVRTLGSGASGVVQKAFLPRESRFVAVKKISVLERDKRHQLMNDIKALCNAPVMDGLIRFYGAYHAADRGQIAVVLEYMDGGSLADVVQRVERVPEPMLAGITARILPALAYMHSRHMVHRDIKPANILISTDGQPKVSDFGISAFMDNTIAQVGGRPAKGSICGGGMLGQVCACWLEELLGANTWLAFSCLPCSGCHRKAAPCPQCHTFLGTVTYMSPERINGQPYSFPADIWALGLTLLECATGKYPYDASGGTIQLMIQVRHFLLEQHWLWDNIRGGQEAYMGWTRERQPACWMLTWWLRLGLQLMEEECPLPPEGKCSPELRDFVAQCMRKDPWQRPTAEQLMSHPFVARKG